MITLHAITDPHSKIIALQGLADELAHNPKCKTAHHITLMEIRKLEMKLEVANNDRAAGKGFIRPQALTQNDRGIGAGRGNQWWRGFLLRLPQISLAGAFRSWLGAGKIRQSV